MQHNFVGVLCARPTVSIYISFALIFFFRMREKLKLHKIDAQNQSETERGVLRTECLGAEKRSAKKTDSERNTIGRVLLLSHDLSAHAQKTAIHEMCFINA